jgi:hypothetical protein
MAHTMRRDPFARGEYERVCHAPGQCGRCGQTRPRVYSYVWIRDDRTQSTSPNHRSANIFCAFDRFTAYHPCGDRHAARTETPCLRAQAGRAENNSRQHSETSLAGQRGGRWPRILECRKGMVVRRPPEFDRNRTRERRPQAHRPADRHRHHAQARLRR